jgi:hypothetical protein
MADAIKQAEGPQYVPSSIAGVVVCVQCGSLVVDEGQQRHSKQLHSLRIPF